MGTAGTGNGTDDDSDTVVDDGCPSSKFTYGALNRLQSSADALGRVTSYQYDAASNLTQRTDARNLITKYFPDALNRLDLVEHWNGQTLVDSVDHTYNAVGFRTQMVDPTGTTTFTPDALDRLASVTFPGPKTVSYTYDDLPGGSAADHPGQRTVVTYPDSKTVSYTYLANGAMSTVTDWLTQQTTYTYNNGGMLTKTQLPNGVWTDYGYDTADRLTSVINKKTGPVTLSSFTYSLDATGSRTQMVDLSGTHSYVYDALNRLTQVTYPGPQTDSYGYDAVGNRLTKNAASYTYDAADEMLTAGGVNYGYDNNGNQTSRGTDTFTYDHENRLTQSVISGTTSSSIYNGDGLRMSHTVGGQTTNYNWDINANLPVILQDGTNSYVLGLDLISATDGSGAQTYFTYDGIGSTTDLTDGSGNLLATYSYDVFGAIRSQTGSSGNYWQFTGEQRDQTENLYYLRARQYDPNTGRFLGRDPLRAGHAYAYVGNSPVNFTDPAGLHCRPLHLHHCPGEVAEGGEEVIGGAVDAGGDVVGGVGDAGEWWFDQWLDRYRAYIDYYQNVYHHPGGYFQETFGLWVAWFSFSDRSRIDYEGGVTAYEDCTGICSWQRLFGYRGWALGHNIFIQGTLDCLLREHELEHVSHSVENGPFWLFQYVWESIQHGYADNRFETEADAAAFERCSS